MEDHSEGEQGLILVLPGLSVGKVLSGALVSGERGLSDMGLSLCVFPIAAGDVYT